MRGTLRYSIQVPQEAKTLQGKEKLDRIAESTAPPKPAPLKDHTGFPQGAAAHLAPGWGSHFSRNCDRLVLEVIRVEWRGILWCRWTRAL